MSQGVHSDVVQMDKKFTCWLVGAAPQSMAGQPIMVDGFLPSRCGWSWYFDAMLSSYDQLDMFDEALAQAIMAIGYFEKENSLGNKGDFLFRKASILQQRASLRSQSPEMQDAARQDIIGSVEAVYDSLEISSADWESDCGQLLDVLAKISKRLGVTRSDLGFVRWDSQAGSIVSRFFPTGIQPVDEASFSEAARHLDLACRARDERNHPKAEQEFLFAFKAAADTSPQVRVLKAFIS